jgi:hypothetical protein
MGKGEKFSFFWYGKRHWGDLVVDGNIIIIII